MLCETNAGFTPNAARFLKKERYAEIYKVAARHSLTTTPSAPLRNGTILLMAQPPLLKTAEQSSHLTPPVLLGSIGTW